MIASPIMHRFGRCFQHLLRDDICFVTLYTVRRSVYRWRHKIRKIAVEILQSVNNPTQSLPEILRMVIIDTVINTILGRLTLDPAGMHCPSCDDAFVSSYRQDAACFYSQAKNQVFRPAGATRCTDSGQTWQDRRAPGSAWLCKISRL